MKGKYAARFLNVTYSGQEMIDLGIVLGGLKREPVVFASLSVKESYELLRQMAGILIGIENERQRKAKP